MEKLPIPNIFVAFLSSLRDLFIQTVAIRLTIFQGVQ